MTERATSQSIHGQAATPTEASEWPAITSPREDVAVFPYLVFLEFLSALLISIGLLAWSLAMNAPLLAEANPGKTENPAKAPWYFVGLQELLVYFDPWIAGVAIPTLIIVGLMAIPYLDTSRGATGRYTFTARRLPIAHFAVGFALWWLLIAFGELMRGPDWRFYLPWESWVVRKGAAEELWSFPWWLGAPALVIYFGAGLALPRWRWPWLYEGLGRTRYTIAITLTLLMYGIPIKILLRLLLGTRYILVTPWFNV